MNARSIYYDPMENIIIDGIMFKKEIYSNLVPRIYNLFLRFLRRSGLLFVYVGNSYICTGVHIQKGTFKCPLGNCNLR